MEHSSLSGRMETHEPSNMKQSGGTTHAGCSDSQRAPSARGTHLLIALMEAAVYHCTPWLRVPAGHGEAQMAWRLFSSQQWWERFQCERAAPAAPWSSLPRRESGDLACRVSKAQTRCEGSGFCFKKCGSWLPSLSSTKTGLSQQSRGQTTTLSLLLGSTRTLWPGQSPAIWPAAGLQLRLELPIFFLSFFPTPPSPSTGKGWGAVCGGSKGQLDLGTGARENVIPSKALREPQWAHEPHDRRHPASSTAELALLPSSNSQEKLLRGLRTCQSSRSPRLSTVLFSKRVCKLSHSLPAPTLCESSQMPTWTGSASCWLQGCCSSGRQWGHFFLPSVSQESELFSEGTGIGTWAEEDDAFSSAVGLAGWNLYCWGRDQTSSESAGCQTGAMAVLLEAPPRPH